MLKFKNVKYKLWLTAILLGIIIVLYFLKIHCPIRMLTGVNCLGCGMTRAFLSAIKLDFVAAFNFHKMFWSLPLLYLCFLKDGRLFKNKTINIIFLSFMGLGFLINWLIGIF